MRFGLANRPGGVSWAAVHGVGWLAGIGFTMSLFIAGLAFSSEESLLAAKVGILGGSLVAGLVGAMLVRRAIRREGDAPPRA